MESIGSSRPDESPACSDRPYRLEHRDGHHAVYVEAQQSEADRERRSKPAQGAKGPNEDRAISQQVD